MVRRVRNACLVRCRRHALEFRLLLRRKRIPLRRERHVGRLPRRAVEQGEDEVLRRNRDDCGRGTLLQPRPLPEERHHAWRVRHRPRHIPPERGKRDLRIRGGDGRRLRAGAARRRFRRLADSRPGRRDARGARRRHRAVRDRLESRDLRGARPRHALHSRLLEQHRDRHCLRDHHRHWRLHQQIGGRLFYHRLRI